MYVKKVRKKGAKDGKKIYDYLHLVQTIRTPKGPRQQLLLNLGALPIEKKEWRVFAKEVERELTGQEVIVKPRVSKRLRQCITNTVNRLLEKQGQEVPVPDIKKEKLRDIQSVDVNSIKTKTHKSIGAEHVCHEVYKQLDIDRFFKTKGVSERNAGVIEDLIVGRLLAPGSERHTKAHLEMNSSLHELTGSEGVVPLTTYYRANDIITQHREALERHLNDKEETLFDLKGQVILYDLTNTYIEGSGKKNDKARYGRSKDKRYDCPLMTLGLVLTSEGFVKKSQLFSGNQAEAKTLKDMITELDVQKKQTVILDAGIASEENLTWLRDEGYRYLVCSRRRYDCAGITDYVTVKQYTEGTQVQVSLKPDGNELIAYCKSDRKAYTDDAIRTRSEQLFTDALQVMNDGLVKSNTTKKYEKVIERIGRLKEKFSSAQKNYQVSIKKSKENPANVGEISWYRIQAVKPEYDGIYVLRTNNLNYSALELWNTYRTLNRVEDSFRYMKAHLGFRPIYHQITKRAEAHLFISVLAYRIWSIISYQLRKRGDHRNWLSIKQSLLSHSRYSICYDQVHDNRTFPVFMKQCSEPTEDQISIYRALNIPDTPLPIKKLQCF